LKTIYLLEEFICGIEWSEEIDWFPVYGISVLMKVTSFLVNDISVLINELFPYVMLLLSGLVDILWIESILLDVGFRSCCTAVKKKVYIILFVILIFGPKCNQNCLRN